MRNERWPRLARVVATGLWVLSLGASLSVSLSVSLAAGLAHAQIVDPVYDAIAEKAKLRPRLGKNVPLDCEYVDEDGHKVKLSSIITGERPTVLAIVYYRCPKMCNLVMDGMVKGLKDIPGWTPGRQYDVLVVSMDPRDTPEDSTYRRDVYLKKFGSAESAASWHFLTGTEPQIRRVTDSVGFGYAWQEDVEEYAHDAGIFLLSPQGKLTRCLNGIVFPHKDLRLALVEAGEGRVGTWIDRFRLFCMSWDPVEHRYVKNAVLFAQLGGGLTVLALGTLMFVLFRGERRRGAGRPGTTASHTTGAEDDSQHGAGS